jgi:hypothetical protein
LAAELCRGAASKCPADCARAAPYRRQQLTGAERVRLCRACRRSPQLPPKCVAGAMKSKVSSAAAVALCAGATSLAPMECFDRIWRKRSLLGKLVASPDVAAALCASSSSSAQIDPATCILALPQQLRAKALQVDDLLALCGGAQNAAPARCLTSVLKGIHLHAASQTTRAVHGRTAPAAAGAGSAAAAAAAADTPLQWSLRFCRGARADGRQNCHDVAVGSSSTVMAATTGAHRGRAGASKRSRAMALRKPMVRWSDALFRLCREADNGHDRNDDAAAAAAGGIGPAACFRHTPKQILADDAVAARLCHRARGAGPAQCVTEALRLQGGRAALSSASGNRATGGFDDNLVFLCARARDSIPAQCLSRAVSANMDAQSALRLCKGVQSTAPADCAISLLQKGSTKNHMRNSNIRHATVELAASVCAGATSNAPAKCARASPGHLPLAVMAHICRGARNAGPGQCAFSGARIPSLALKPGVSWQIGKEQPLLSRLCEGATSQGPVECFQVRVGSLSPEDRVRLCAGAAGETPARCVQAIRVRSMSSMAKLALCRGSVTTAPATCANRMPVLIGGYTRSVNYDGDDGGGGGGSGGGNDNGATTDSQSEGGRDDDGSDRFERQQLEKAAGKFVSPAVSSSSMGLAHLCRGARERNPDGPGSCFQSAPASLSAEERVDLCRRAISDAPAECAAAAISKARGKFTSRQLVALCGHRGVDPSSRARGHDQEHEHGGRAGGASDMRPEDCIGAAPTSWEPELRLALCRSALYSTISAVRCAGALSKHPGLLADNELKLELCLSAKGDADDGEDAGTKNSKKSSKQKEQKKKNTHRSQGKTPSGGRAHPWMPAGIATVECVRQAPSRLVAAQTVRLCKGATTVMPAKCARLAPHSLGGDQVVQLCQDAVCLTPAYCALAVIHSRPSSSSVVGSTAPTALSQCKGILPVASSIIITSSPNLAAFHSSDPTRVQTEDAEAPGTLPYLGSGGTVALDAPLTAHVVDQFGQRMGALPDDFVGQNRLPRQLVVVVDKGREMGAFISGDTITGPTLFEDGPSAAGRFVFQDLSMRASSAGVLWLRVSASDEESNDEGHTTNSIRPALVPIRVEGESAPDHCWSTSGCDFLYHQLASPWHRRRGSKRTLKQQTGEWARSSEIGFSGMIRGGALMGLFCADSLAAHGVSVYASGVSGNLILQGEKYHVGKIKSRVGAPHESMGAEERLGLVRTAEGAARHDDARAANSSHSIRDIKRAYRMRALEWHPDKWARALSISAENNVGNSKCAHRVRNSFRLIIDAFNTLAPESRNMFESSQQSD